MRRFILPVLFAGLVIAPVAFAQEHSSAPAKESNASEHEAAGEEDHLLPWKWVNLIILAGGLAYLLGKNAGPFFSTRAGAIRKEMTEAAEFRKDAEARAAGVESRLNGLEAEIAALRAEAVEEQRNQAQRVAEHTASEIAKIQANAEQEIAAAAKAARADLKRHAAELAVRLAGQRIRETITPQQQEALARGFVRNLEAPASQAQTI